MITIQFAHIGMYNENQVFEIRYQYLIVHIEYIFNGVGEQRKLTETVSRYETDLTAWHELRWIGKALMHTVLFILMHPELKTHVENTFIDTVRPNHDIKFIIGDMLNRRQLTVQ